jgi:hypothetical protein
VESQGDGKFVFLQLTICSIKFEEEYRKRIGDRKGAESQRKN